MRVLLIEDNDGDADLVSEALNDAATADIDIARVDRLEAAAALLTQERFDVVLLDLSLPDAIGLEGLRRLRETAPEAPIVVLTGNSDKAAGTRAIQNGAQDYLQKGEVEGSELLRAIRYARERAEYMERTRLLVDVGIAVSSSLDATEMLASLEKTLTAQYSDFCCVDGAQMPVSGDAGEDAPLSADVFAGNTARSPSTLRPAQLFVDFTDVAPDNPHREAIEGLRARGLATAVVVPFRLVGWPNGALTCARRATSSPFGPGDLAFTEEITRRAVTALEHAGLLAVARRERDRAEVAARSRDEFLATLSHELRTPLTAILGWTQLLLAGSVPPERHTHALQTIERNTRSQVALIEEVLDVSRIITGKLRVSITTVDVRAILSAAHDSVRPAADAKGLTIELDGGVEPLTLEADPDRLLQVLWNLLSNAVKFTPRGGKITVASAKVEEQIEIRVCDNGQGIEAAFLPHVFERFRQADSSITRDHGGLGLGLAITRHLVEVQGGTIRVESAGARHGSTFIVRLPLRSRLADSATAVPRVAVPIPRASGVEGASGSLAGLSILVVDDDVETQELLQTMLEWSGAAVLTASSAADALRAIVANPPDVLLSDIGMPGESGYELIRNVRELKAPRGGRLAAIAVTGFARPQDRVNALRLGFDNHLTKPVDIDELVTVIKSVTRRVAAR